MSYGLDRLSTRTKLIAGALALVIAGVSHANSTTLVGGGATLPSIGYVGPNAATMTQVSGGNISASSLFGVALPNASYCLTGSGSGKNILAGIANNNVQDTCPIGVVSGVTVHGFGAPAVGRTDLTQPNFAAADAPLSASDYSNYKSIHTASNANPTEFPAVVGAVAIAFNLLDNTGAQVTSWEVNFTEAQLCQIFSGQSTNWSDPRLASAFNLPAGHSILSAPINVQYRSDGSGTTFSLSNHLSAACNTTTNPLETSQKFFTNIAGATYVVQNFFTTTEGLPNGDGTFTPRWTGSSGDAAIAAAIANTANSIGYVATANAIADRLQMADVDGRSPTANFNSTLRLTALSVQNNAVISSTNNANGTPAIQAISNPPATKCIVLVKPADYALANNNAGNINPAGNYPIVAVSYLLGNTAGNGNVQDLVNTKTLLNAPYNTTVQGKVKTIGGTTGLQFLNVSAAFSTTAAGTCLVN